MHLELPERLLATRDVLMRSLPTHPLEKAPAMPAGLAADLAARFAPKASVAPVTVSVSWFERVRAFLATPGFGAAAAAVVVLGVAAPLMMNKDKAPAESFRGGETVVAAGDAVRIIFAGENAAVRSAVTAAGDFESSAMSGVADAAAAKTVAGPKVVVDFTAGTITGYDAQGAEVRSEKLPADAAKVSGAIADVVSRL